MASPLIGIAGVNSLLFTSYAISKRIVSPFPELSLKQTAAAGAMAGAANSILASPGTSYASKHTPNSLFAQSKCSKCECKASMEQRGIKGSRVCFGKCGASMDSEEALCEDFGYV